jgi:hypothetical protein
MKSFDARPPGRELKIKNFEMKKKNAFCYQVPKTDCEKSKNCALTDEVTQIKRVKAV